ncbi:MAG: MobF family relaxase, partial [Myxococcaceae bacterium]
MRSDWRYLTRHTREGRSRDDGERSRDDTPRDRERGHEARDYYTTGVEHGEPPGTWWGRGADSLGLRGEVTEDVMEKLYGGLTDPATGEPLGSPPREYASFEDRLAALLAKEPDATPERVAELELAARKSHREARTYADLTFSPPKSWSVLHAALEHAGRHEEAAQVWDAWEAGAHAGLEYLMDEAGYSRAGYHGAKIAGRTSGRWVDAHDYVISLWRHHTSRDGDPQMHIHAAVLNRVLCEDGEWRSLDSQAISAARPAAGAISERVAEERLTAALGVEFRTRPDGKAREIAGIGEDDRDLFSSHRRAITEGVRELAATYEARHGKAPGRYVLRLMAEHVTLKTRDRKPDQTPRREELLGRWERSIQD